MSQAVWTIVANNDILVPARLLRAVWCGLPRRKQFDVASPAMCEGEADYDWPTYAAEFMRVMAPASRRQRGFRFFFHGSSAGF